MEESRSDGQGGDPDVDEEETRRVCQVMKRKDEKSNATY